MRAAYITSFLPPKKGAIVRGWGSVGSSQLNKKTLTWIGRHCSLRAKDDQILASGYLMTIYEEQMFLNIWCIFLIMTATTYMLFCVSKGFFYFASPALTYGRFSSKNCPNDSLYKQNKLNLFILELNIAHKPQA